MVSRRGEQVPAFDRRGASFLDCEHQVLLWMRAARAEETARASLLILHTQPAPRQVCLAKGRAILDHNGGVAKIFEILRNYFAPVAVDAIHQRVMQFMRFRPTEQYVDEYFAE